MTTLGARTWWWAWLAGGTAAAVLYPVLPWGWWKLGLSPLSGLLACAVVVAGIRRHRPAALGSWSVFLAGLILWVLGDAVFAYQQLVMHSQAYPSPADYLYLSAYPPLVVGLFGLTRQRGPVWSGNLIDSAIVAIGIGIVYWTFVIEPVLTDTGLPLPARIVSVGYPTASVLVCGVVTPILLRRGPRTVSLWLLTAGATLTLVCNVVYTLFPQVLADSQELVWAGFLLAYILWAAAAAHPTMKVPPPDIDGLGRSRLIVLTASMLMVPATLLIQERTGGRFSWGAVAFGSMALFVLIVSRMSGYIARVDHQAGQLRELAMHDDLTGLPNRREFDLRVAEAVAAGPCHVIVIDLAGFKHINDRLGRAVGDQALAAVAALLRDRVRGDDLVARLGADEFAVLVRSAPRRNGETVAERLLDLLRHPVQAGEHELLLNARLGVAVSHGDIPAGELVRRADTARYAAKAAGLPVLDYTADLDERAEAAERLAADLRHSLDDGDFHVVYQPIVALCDGSTVAVEALVRWQHPVRGFVSPAAFIPVAEDNGLIVELGEWVMRTSCRQFATWHRDLGDAAPGYVSVNVSARQLSEPGFPDVVAGILTETGLPPAALLVEVTETALFTGGTAVEAVEALHRSGVRIALDDFGTGHSSLGLLRTVPVDVIKVDKSFVDEIIEPGKKPVIVDALIHVTTGLGLRAVAEGVETAEQADYLRELGYHLGQGYFFSKPVPQPDFLTRHMTSAAS
ncbi:bifunctional diguanylate cyclase/phosphodiesterase [Actinoplanes sp. NBRC 101535]|uniref:putative bifunctional diguanylate cyclase/phosphodiesterase n=1 Tax=Actinoplanes sp. NBRC 101535 TaxID=3032196 RepID=UPI002552FDA3|nr:bifunctional diguanylate cyclase/phosphodiesterase [Actinoplanes sp. NBRC 101535]